MSSREEKNIILHEAVRLEVARVRTGFWSREDMDGVLPIGNIEVTDTEDGVSVRFFNDADEPIVEEAVADEPRKQSKASKR